jgi:hypothetical protein
MAVKQKRNGRPSKNAKNKFFESKKIKWQGISREIILGKIV